MISAFERLQAWFGDRNHLIGIAALFAYVSVGHAILWYVVPNANLGLDLGLVLFAVLTAQSVERARTVRSVSLAVWLLAGFLVSMAIGAACYSFRND